MRKRTLQLLLAGVCTGFLLAALYRFEVSLQDAFTQLSVLLSPEGLLGALGVWASYALRAARISGEFKPDIKLSPAQRFVACLRLGVIHNFWVNILPLRAGEAAFPLQLKQQFGVAISRSTTSLLWLRVQDLIVLLGCAAALMPSLHLAQRLAAIGALALAGMAIPLWALGKLPVVSDRRWFENIAVLERIRLALAPACVHPGKAWGWTLGIWFSKFLGLALILSTLMQSTVSQAAMGVFGAELSAVLPIQGFAGFGTYEAGAWVFLEPLSVPSALALHAALGMHLFLILSAGASAACALALPRYQHD